MHSRHLWREVDASGMEGLGKQDGRIESSSCRDQFERAKHDGRLKAGRDESNYTNLGNS
jgi:hypothetical protein